MIEFAAFWRDRRAGAAATVGLLLPALAAALSFGIDSALIQVEQTSLQNAADAAAAAGASKVLAMPEQVAATAIEFANANVASTPSGTILANHDVVTGYWDSTAKTWTPNSGNSLNNGVRVTVRKAEVNGNQHKLIFGRAIGIAAVDLSATATAIAAPTCTLSTTTALVSTAKPNRTSVVTQGEPCMFGSGYLSSQICYWASPAGNPIIRIDNSYEGAAAITFKLASNGQSFTFNAPKRGSFWQTLTDYTLPNTGAVTMVFNTFRSSPAAPQISTGTATYVSRFNVAQTLPGTPLCEPGTSRTKVRLAG